MKFGVFYEHQLPRPWHDGDEPRIYREALEQVELADRLGIDHAWEVEHHFLEEYSHSSAPEVFLAACSQRTERIRLGHGICLMPPAYNHPARVAERVATLDLVSDGRVELGTGESASALELEGFGVDPAAKREMWREAVTQCTDMMVAEPYPGHAGRYFSMPCRNIVPKPVQRPHPPLWMACAGRETIREAARCGVGALTFAFVDADEARHWVEEYYRTFREECVPIGHAVNPNICMVSAFSLHRDEDEAMRRGLEGFLFFRFALGWHYGIGEQRPGRTDIWAEFERQGPQLDRSQKPAGIGTPAQLREHLQAFAEAGVDQVAFLQQAGRNRHEHICEALELFADEVMPAFREGEDERERAKLDALAPDIERAMARKREAPALHEADIETVLAYPRRG